MEALSGVASGMAVVSLTVQLLQSTNAIKTFVRDVKGASKELERLAELLERLGTVLTDVRDVIERQVSLQHCPLPSQAMFDCLKSCEISLGSLEEIKKKYEIRRGASASAMRKLRDDIRFGLKLQDITSLEARIQRDINSLNTALGTNATNIQLTTLSVLLRHEQASLTKSSSPHPYQSQMTIPLRTTANSVSQQITSVVSSQYGIHTKTHQQWISSSLCRFGIHQRKSIRQTSVTKDQNNETGNTSNEVTFASYEAIWGLIGYGIHWSKGYPYGNISPALRVFPIVQELFQDTFFIFQSSIQEIQQAFRSGILHPFAKDQTGVNLLHYAVFLQRADVCHLLLEYGVKAELSTLGFSPLLFGLNGLRPGESDETRIDILRLLLTKFDLVDDLDSSLSPLLSARWLIFHHAKDSKMVIEWFWTHAVLAFHGTGLLHLRVKLLHALVHSYDVESNEHNNEVHDLLIKLMDDQIVAEYLKGTYTFIKALFSDAPPAESKWLGDAFLRLLASLNLDAEACIAMELACYPGGLLEPLYSYFPRRRVIFEKDQTQNAILRCAWAYDPHALGYHLVSEFNAFTVDTIFYGHGSEWPFFEHDNDDDWSITDEHYGIRERNRAQRFDRRTATKARKERARTGQKRPRSRMPGTWDW